MKEARDEKPTDENAEHDDHTGDEKVGRFSRKMKLGLRPDSKAIEHDGQQQHCESKKENAPGIPNGQKSDGDCNQ